jgi:cell division protein FtsW
MKKAKKNWSNADFIMFSTVMLMIAVGIIMVFSASSYSAGHSKSFGYDYMYFFKKQALWAAIGTVALLFTINFDYHKLRKYTLLFIIVTYVCLCLVFLFHPINGARRWINLGFTTFQPSEIAKYAAVFYMASSIDRKGEKIKNFFNGVVPILIVSCSFAALVLMGSNLSIASVIMMVTLIMLFTAGAKMLQFGVIAAFLGAAGVYFIESKPYRLNRLLSFTNPFADPQKNGYQLVQSLLALGSGGIWGVGLGRSRQKCYYLPEPHNDFIFAVIGEELGIMGSLFFIMLFLVLIWRGIRTAIKAKDNYGMLLAIGITSVLAIQAVINIAVVTGSMPVTGVPLPFISYGGSSLVINMMAVGVLLNISRQCEK